MQYYCHYRNIFGTWNHSINKAFFDQCSDSELPTCWWIESKCFFRSLAETNWNSNQQLHRKMTKCLLTSLDRTLVVCGGGLPSFFWLPRSIPTEKRWAEPIFDFETRLNRIALSSRSNFQFSNHKIELSTLRRGWQCRHLHEVLPPHPLWR